MGLVKKDDGWRTPDEVWAKMEPVLSPRPWHPLGCHNESWRVGLLACEGHHTTCGKGAKPGQLHLIGIGANAPADQHEEGWPGERCQRPDSSTLTTCGCSARWSSTTSRWARASPGRSASFSAWGSPGQPFSSTPGDGAMAARPQSLQDAPAAPPGAG